MGTLIKGRRLGLVTVLGALVLAPAACGHSPPARGDIDLIATVPAGVAVEALAFELSGNGIAPRTGGVHVSKPQQQFETLINSVPVDDDYELEVSATSTDGRLTCKGGTKISVRKSSVTRVHLALTCSDDGGKVVIAVAVACSGAHLVNYTISPLSAAVGDSIAVTATMIAPDAGALTYDWSAPSGTFADPSSAQTTYQCETTGFVTLNLRVTASACVEEEQSIDVDCLPPERDAAAD
jgi:hypothetical protein